MSRGLLVSVMGVAVGLAGCGPMPTGGNTSNDAVRLRVVHASPDAPAVDVCANGQAAFEGASFPGATSYATLEAGIYAIRVTGADAGCESPGVINADLPLSAGQDVTVVALNLLEEIEPLVLTDENSDPSEGNAKVRFVHASPDAPTVDITLTDGTILFDNVSFKQASAYLEVPAGSYDLQVRDETGAAVVLTQNDVELDQRTVYTVFAIGLIGGNPALDALITVDSE